MSTSTPAARVTSPFMVADTSPMSEPANDLAGSAIGVAKIATQNGTKNAN